MNAYSRILVRGPNWIGDHVMAIPFYRALCEAYPVARRVLLCSEAVAGLELGDLFSETIRLSPEDRRFPSGVRNMGRRLRKENFDLGISLPASFSSAFLLHQAKIPTRLGFRGDGGRFFLTQSLPWRGMKAGLHKSRMYLDLMRYLRGTGALEGTDLRAHFASAHPRERLIVVAPGASIPLREWPYFIELIETLRREFPDYRIAVVGAKSEEKWHGFLDRINQTGQADIEDWVERTSLTEVISLCKKAAVVVANDSGIAHCAATLADAPTVVLFGPGNPDYIIPLGARVEGVRVKALPCSPCEKSYCRAPYGYARCLKDLSVDVVLQAVLRVLSL